jgi:hypothetical protein
VAYHERTHANTHNTNHNIHTAKMGNANSQMLENIVQGSNCMSFLPGSDSFSLANKKHTDHNETIH